MVNNCKVRVDLLTTEGITDAEALVLATLRNTVFGSVTATIQNGVIVAVTTEVCVQVAKFFNKPLDKAAKP